MQQKYMWRTLCGNCWGEKWRMWEGREADGLLQCENTQLSAGRPGKCISGPYKWHPARPVSSWTTLIPPLGLYSESQTPTYTVKRKGYFWKMGPTSWFNSLTNPRKRGFSPLGDNVIQTEIRLQLGSSLFLHPHFCTHAPAHTLMHRSVSFLIHHWSI